MAIDISSFEVYPKIPIKKVIEIDKIISLYYFEYAKNSIFPGESHDFWEFLYVDKGQAAVMAGVKGYQLEQGDIIFHKPYEFHSVWANGKVAPNLIVVSFVCDSPAMKFFENKILSVGEQEKSIIAAIFKERTHCFNNKLDDLIREKDIRPDEMFGAQQLIGVYLELLLITIIRNNSLVKKHDRASSITRNRIEEDLIERIIYYMKENVDQNLNIDDFCIKFSLSRTRLKSLFKGKMDTGIIQYFRQIKIEKAKELMREEKYNFTEISDMLGFSSTGYFSSVFKKITGMTPTEYVTSVKCKAELL